MKTKLFFNLTLLLFLGLLSNAQSPNLGTSSNYVLFSSNGAVTNSGITHLTGNVGTNNGSSTGFGNVDGVMHDGDGSSLQAANDLLTVYNQLNGLIPTFYPASLLGNGATLNAGIYSISGTATLNSNLILDGQGNPNALFVFKIQGAFSTNALSSVTLINGAKACNVFWKTEGLVSMATGTIMKGTVIANNAAIMISTNTNLEGRALSTTGAITVDGITAKTPIGCGSPILNGPVAPNLASTVCYAIFSGSGNVTNAGITNVAGDIGTNVGLTTGYNSTNVNGSIHPLPDTSTAQCANDLLNVYTYLNTLPYDIQLLYPAQFGNNLVLTPHTYLLNAATVFTNSVYLDAQNNANAVFVIKIYGALSTSTYSNVILINGAQAKNIYWLVTGAVDLNDYSTFNGNIICNNGAINASTSVSATGRLLTTNGVLTTSAITINVTSDCTSLSIGAINPITKNTIAVFYPNPFTDTLTIQMNDTTTNCELTIYDTVGKIVAQQTISDTTTVLNLNLSAGMYYYKLINNSGLIQTGKILSK